MESAVTWEYMSLINELTQGREKTKQLCFHLSLTSPSEAEIMLLQRILSSFEKALMILKWKGSATGAAHVASGPPPESSISVNGSPESDQELNRWEQRQPEYSTPKKRKHQPTWTEQVRVSSNSGLEGPGDDGYSWRKYGQKDILGAKHPRSYYRCTYRAVQNCSATKQVQRSDEDPTVFEVTYKGTHTCSQSINVAASHAAITEKQDPKHGQSQQQTQTTLMNFKTNLRVSTEYLDNKETTSPTVFSFPSTYASSEIDNHYFPITNPVDENHLVAYSPLFLSPATSESNYFSPATYQMNSYKGTVNFPHTESDIAEIISAHASTTNSPIGGAIEFPVDPAELDQDFPFNTAGFFS